MPGEGIVPPQGFGGKEEKPKYFYGLPMSTATGGGGTKIILVIKMPPSNRSGGGVTARISAGETHPYTPPPVVQNPTYAPKNGSGSGVIVSSAVIKSAVPMTGGTFVYISPVPTIIIQCNGGTAANKTS